MSNPQNPYAYEPSIDPNDAKATIRKLETAIRHADRIVTQISYSKFPNAGPIEIEFLEGLANVTAYMRGLWDYSHSQCFPTLREAVEYAVALKENEKKGVSGHPLLRIVHDVDDLDRMELAMTIEAEKMVPID